MKQKTKKPSKQRKRMFLSAYHERTKYLSANLSTELKDSNNTRSLPVRKGDRIRVLRGDYKGIEGRIQRVDRKSYRIYIDGINREKADGTKILVPIHPSKVQIIKLNLDDKLREEILKRKGSKIEENVFKKNENSPKDVETIIKNLGEK
jgi:large subunit ribosomal protein L24